MEDELFSVYDEQGNACGEDIRANVHRYGLWHAVIHVWVYDPSELDPWIYIQRRSIHKKDFAGLYDITTAGHVDANESFLQAAIRECQEEIGLTLLPERLHYLGDIKEAVYLTSFYDKEIAHVFVYPCIQPQFHIGEEVDMMMKARKSDFLTFAKDKRKSLRLYSLDQHQQIQASQGAFCHHADKYYRWILAHCNSLKEGKNDGK